MAKVSGHGRDDVQMELPPGFRFHPSDEELITYYLTPKALDDSFSAKAIGEVDLNKVEPWDLPWKAKLGEREWYFFCVRDRKYPSGLRTNRATQAGYWKATGKDKDIFRGKSVVGMKKTLVFYKGRAPRGEKTSWVMHEYRLEGKFKHPKATKNDWAISRVFRKSSCGKKTHISNLVRPTNEFQNSGLPPLMDLSPHDNQRRTTAAETCHVTCFSQSMEGPKPQKDKIVENLKSPFTDSPSCYNPSHASNSSFSFPYFSAPASLFPNQLEPCIDPVFMEEQSILRLLLENDGQNMNTTTTAEFSQDTAMSTDISSAVSKHEVGQRSYEDHDYPITSSSGHVDLDYMWNY